MLSDENRNAIELVTQRTTKDRWDKLKIIAVLVGTVAVPLSLGLIGSVINRSVKEREAQGRLVEVAIGILERDPRTELGTPGLREWAIEVVDRYSGVPLPESAREELREEPLPSARVSSLEKGIEVLARDIAVTLRERGRKDHITVFAFRSLSEGSPNSEGRFLALELASRLWLMQGDDFAVVNSRHVESLLAKVEGEPEIDATLEAARQAEASVAVFGSLADLTDGATKVAVRLVDTESSRVFAAFSARVATVSGRDG